MDNTPDVQILDSAPASATAARYVFSFNLCFISQTKYFIYFFVFPFPCNVVSYHQQSSAGSSSVTSASSTSSSSGQVAPSTAASTTAATSGQAAFSTAPPPANNNVAALNTIGTLGGATA